MSALERYDGLFHRVARKYRATVKYVDVFVVVDDLTIVKAETFIQYSEPEGSEWGLQKFAVRILNESRRKNEV